MVCKGGTDQFLHFYGGTQKLSMFEHYTFRWVGLSVGRSVGPTRVSMCSET